MIRNRIREAIPPRFESNADRVTYLLSKYRIGIYVAALAAIVLVSTGYLSVSIPTWLEILLIGIAVGILPATAIGYPIVRALVPDPRVKAQVFETSEDGAAIEPKRIPRDLWEDREVDDLPIWQINGGTTDVVLTEIEHVDEIGKLRVRGVDPELADPVSMATRDRRLSAVFGDLSERARELAAKEGTEGLRQIEIEQRVMNEIVRSVEKSTSIDPGAFEDVIRSDPDTSSEPRADEIDGDRQTVNDVLGPTEGQSGQPAATDGGRTE